MELYRRKSGFSTEGFKDFGAVVGFAEDELQEEDHLGKQPFVPKAILRW